MSELKPNSELFAGRYKVEGLSGTDDYGYIYEAVDASDDARVIIHEFFPAGMCHRDPETQNMSILKASAPQASALYRKFSDYVMSLREGKVPGLRLSHAFKDHGTAYYVLPSVKSARVAPAPPASEIHEAPRPSVNAAGSVQKRERKYDDRSQRLSASETGKKLSSCRNAILWYRIIIVLLVAIVALLVYLNFFTSSPKVVASETVVQQVEAEIQAPIDSLPGL